MLNWRGHYILLTSKPFLTINKITQVEQTDHLAYLRTCTACIHDNATINLEHTCKNIHVQNCAISSFQDFRKLLDFYLFFIFHWMTESCSMSNCILKHAPLENASFSVKFMSVCYFVFDTFGHKGF